MGYPARFPHVLQIDDSQSTLDLRRDLLETAGYQVSVTPDRVDMLPLKALLFAIAETLTAQALIKEAWPDPAANR